MSEDRTKETKDPRTFEERVFARFDAVDDRFDRVEGRLASVEIRITNLEERQYDTKPIWERALAEIVALRNDFQTGNEALRNDLRSEFQTANEALRNDLHSEFQTGIQGFRIEMKAEFASMQHKMEHELRGVARKMDVLNQTLFQIQVDQRYFDRQLAEFETRIEQQ
jgi:hypothetical protein